MCGVWWAMLWGRGGSKRTPVKSQISVDQQASPYPSACASGILKGMRIVLTPDLMNRRYTEIADRVSMPARRLFWALVAVAENDRIGEDTLCAAPTQRGYGWTQEQV
jgi:hypothetical protein